MSRVLWDHTIRARLDDTLARYGGQPVSMDIADVLVPVVRGLIAEARADELETRAAVFESMGPYEPAVAAALLLREWAAAIRAEADRG